MNFSKKTLLSPKLDLASLLAAATESSSSFGELTTLIPLPPPPAEAFTKIG